MGTDDKMGRFRKFYIPAIQHNAMRLIKEEGYRIFVAAILLSLGWHMFWLSIIKVVAAPSPKSPVKFSRVSFLGPILAKETMGLRVEPKKLSFLENHYIRAAKKISGRKAGAVGPSRAPGDIMRDTDGGISFDENIISLVGEAVSGQKIEPAYAADPRGTYDAVRP